jgi:hypothetical protein
LLQSSARLSVTSPLITPQGMSGRALSDVTIAGAAGAWAKARGTTSVPAAPARKTRRLTRRRGLRRRGMASPSQRLFIQPGQGHL